MKVTFIGLGSMGMAMAANVARAGHDLTVWTRSGRAPEGFAARQAGTLAEAVRGAEVAVTMLADDAAAEAVVEGGLLDALGEGAIHLSMSTLGIATARRLAAAHEARGQAYVAAPVLGRPDFAAAARLWIITAGAPDAVARVRPLFDALGRGVTSFGEEPWRANLVKLANNFMLLSMMETLGEAFALTRKAGIGAKQFLEVANSLFASPVYANYGGLIAEERFEPPGFRLTLGLKDVRLALAAAEELAVPMPVAAVARDGLLQAIAAGRGGQDWAALGAVPAERAGLPPAGAGAPGMAEG